MKTKLFFTLIFAFQIAFSQTTVSGPYFTNTIWDISGSPYNVVGDVQIPSGITLSIDPGVQINFTGNYEILIKGTIIANGTNSLPINFIGNTAGTAMLMFKSANLSSSQLSSIKFTGPKDGLQLADEGEFNQDPIKNSGVLIIKNVVTVNTAVQTKGYQTTASLIIDSASISTTLIKGVYPRSEPIEIKNSNLSNCTINSDSYNYGITLTNCFSTGSNFTIGCCGGNISLISSNISSSSISDGNGTPVTGPLKITESKLGNTTVNLPSATVEVTSSIINYNTLNGLIFGNGLIKCSQITGNGSGTAVGITGYQGYNIGGAVSINNSTFNQNSIGIKISNANTMTIDSSNFDNNSSYHIENVSTKNITAKNNWWGTTNPTVIANEIHDYYDNINYGIVDFSNELNSIYNSQSCPNSLIFPTTIPENKNGVTPSAFRLNIYPNPTTGNFIIETKLTENETLQVFDLNGRLMLHENIIGNANIDATSLNEGIYNLTIKSKVGLINKKLVIVR